MKKFISNPFVPFLLTMAVLTVMYLTTPNASPYLGVALLLSFMALGAKPVSMSLGLTADTLDIDDVVAEYGAHYVDEGQNATKVKQLIYEPFGTGTYFRSVPTDGDQYKSVLATHDEVLQGFQVSFVNKGKPTFKPHTTNLFKLMVDKAIYPDLLYPSYLGFWEQLDEPSREQWPFIRWYIEMMLVPKMKEDYEIEVAWKGEYSAPTTGTAQDAADAADGLGAIREDLIAAGRISPITTGALSATASTFVAQIEAFADDIDRKYRPALDFIFMDVEKEALYRRGIAAVYNMNYLQMPNVSSVAGHPNLKVVGLASMGVTDVIWTTPAANRIRPVNKNGFENGFKVSARDNKEVIISWSARMGLGWEVPELVFTNDQELSVFS